MEKKKLIKVLKEINYIAGECSLTGAFDKSVSLLIKHYNSCLNEAIKNEYIEKDSLFNELSEDANIDEVGVSAKLLACYIITDED